MQKQLIREILPKFAIINPPKKFMKNPLASNMQKQLVPKNSRKESVYMYILSLFYVYIGKT